MASGAHSAQAAADRQWGAYQLAQATADANAERGFGMLEAQRIRKLGVSQQAEATSAYAASGIDINSGSAQQVQEKIGYNAQYDALTAITQSDYKAKQMIAQGQGQQYKSNIDAMSQDSQATASLFSAGANVLSDWQSAAQTGAFG